MLLTISALSDTEPVRVSQSLTCPSCGGVVETVMITYHHRAIKAEVFSVLS